MASKTDQAQKLASMEQEKRLSEDEFGRQRKKFMQHMRESDEKSMKLQQSLSIAQEEIAHLKAKHGEEKQELDSVIAQKSSDAAKFNETLEATKGKHTEEAASLRKALTMTTDECEAEKKRLQVEMAKLTATGRDRSSSLESSMLQAESETKVLKAVVVPLEQEIESLKSQLKEANNKLGVVSSAATPATGNLIDLAVFSPEPANDSELERKLVSEQRARDDMEMHVATLNSQKVFFQQELEAMHKRLEAALINLEKEKIAHDDLKQTWMNANNHFLELQAQYENELKTLKSRFSEKPPGSTGTQSIASSQESTDGLAQSVPSAMMLETPHAHKRSMSQGLPVLVVPDQFMKASSSLQDVHQENETSSEVMALEEEVKRCKEMCSNYEQQLQRTQQQMIQDMAEKDETIEGIMEQIEKQKITILQERNKRDKLRKTLQQLQEEMKQQVESYQEGEKEMKYTLTNLQENFVKAKRDTQQQVTRMNEERAMLAQQTESAREEYECLKALQSEELHEQLKKLTTAEQAQKEAESNVATTLEELNTLQSKLQVTEEQLRSEVMFLKDQLQSEQNNKDQLEMTLSTQLSTANQDIAKLQKVRKELELEKVEAISCGQAIKEKCKQFVESQAKEMETVKLENHRKQTQLEELNKTVENLKTSLAK